MVRESITHYNHILKEEIHVLFYKACNTGVNFIKRLFIKQQQPKAKSQKPFMMETQVTS